MKKEELEKLGLNDEQIAKLLEAYGNVVPYSRFKEINDKKIELEKTLNDKSKDTNELTTLKSNLETLSKQIEEMKTTAQKEKEEYANSLIKTKISNAIDLALTEKGALNKKAVASLFDMEKIKVENDKVTGIDEQLNAIFESDKYLFKSDEKLKGVTPKGTQETQNTQGTFKTYEQILAEINSKGE